MALTLDHAVVGSATLAELLGKSLDSLGRRVEGGNDGGVGFLGAVGGGTAGVLDRGVVLLQAIEPLAGLGPDESREIVGLIKNLKTSCAILLIEHDIDAVFSIADRITVLDNGRMIASGAPEAVRKDAAVQQAYLGIEEVVP